MASTSSLEVARATHEEIDRYESALVDLLLVPASTHKEALTRSHKASEVLDRIVERAHNLSEFYNGDGSAKRGREEELKDVLEGQPDDEEGDEADDKPMDPTLKNFYSRLKKVREYHERYPGALPDAFSLDLSSLTGVSREEEAAGGVAAGPDFLDRMFSGEEALGRYLDLYTHHEAFVNLKGVKRLPYVKYLGEFEKLAGVESRVPAETKKSEAYRRYVANLSDALFTFLRRTRPTSDVDWIELSALADFEGDWDACKVPGWEDQGSGLCKSGAAQKRQAPQSGAVDEGIWCEACKRTFAKQTVFDAHLKGGKHQKAAANLAAGNAQISTPSGGASGPNASASEAAALEVAKQLARCKALARTEVLIRALASHLGEVVAETRANVERRAALTDAERQAEAEAAVLGMEDSGALPTGTGDAELADQDANGDDENDDKIYNPLKLPLGWDGKPIPYWLYKLHGLRVEYRCEICSDYMYQGPKNFDRHFSESRHAFGMRALGLPNTKHFHGITKIEDALALAEKLKKQGKQQTEAENDAEEVEDEHGNTYTKRTYELLKRQGII
ncbi:hypothetical protein IE81DRAFT_368072 [Ceraceosorus guamensis]|uniref:Matrin-type domain-containing protein n=1 Tax=Ceraceosorus guamensis TaxID=1522189 RepID=A0A316VT86_9BASI|nr:hypothetical protein IE81DRAFT_368072 [Ceraceosorus guamensis]PWN40702.1 hypothetical protein IE81DRAFT_368072 [Ceraceosorus guamensis]